MQFRIDYIDPEDGAAKSVFENFDDTETISAIVCAEDYAYTIADKGYYAVTALL